MQILNYKFLAMEIRKLVGRVITLSVLECTAIKCNRQR